MDKNVTKMKGLGARSKLYGPRLKIQVDLQMRRRNVSSWWWGLMNFGGCASGSASVCKQDGVKHGELEPLD